MIRTEDESRVILRTMLTLSLRHDIAESIGKTGRDAQVLVHAESRTFRKLWVYRKVLYPNSLGRPNNNRIRGTYRLP